MTVTIGRRELLAAPIHKPLEAIKAAAGRRSKSSAGMMRW
jgi:hypothetical protein